jgi:hypothetical protein
LPNPLLKLDNELHVRATVDNAIARRNRPTVLILGDRLGGHVHRVLGDHTVPLAGGSADDATTMRHDCQYRRARLFWTPTGIG